MTGKGSCGLGKGFCRNDGGGGAVWNTRPVSQKQRIQKHPGAIICGCVLLWRKLTVSKVSVQELVDYLDALMQPQLFADYCPNGLQVQGGREVAKVVTGVTASMQFIKEAANAKADAILVHHGWFWKNEPRTLVGVRMQRLQLLLQHGISLIGYHLPLDHHPELGNNAQLARVLELEITGALEPGSTGIGCAGRLRQPMSPQEFAQHIEARLQRKPLLLGSGEKTIETVGWCTGAAQHWMDWAIEQNLDAFISGEVSEQNFHQAHESGMYYYAAGHHATERYGVQALGEQLASHFGVQHQFIDVDNPV